MNCIIDSPSEDGLTDLFVYLLLNVICYKFLVQGIWSGMITGVGLQTLILTGITLATNWKKEVTQISALFMHTSDLSFICGCSDPDLVDSHIGVAAGSRS